MRKVLPKKSVPRKSAAVPIADKEVVTEVQPQDEPKNWIRKALFYLQLRDGFWTVPLLFAITWVVAVILYRIFGYGVGAYDPSVIQSLVYAGAMTFGVFFFAGLIYYYHFREGHRYLWGSHQPAEGIVKNLSKEDLHSITPFKRLCLAIFLFCFIVVCFMAVFIAMI